MKRLLSLLIFFTACVSAAQQFSMDQLQGAWWAKEPSPTAAFAIHGNEVWYDFDSRYHPARIEGDLLIVDLGAELGEVRSRIISVGDGRLVLQNLDAPSEPTTYTLAEP